MSLTGTQQRQALIEHTHTHTLTASGSRKRARGGAWHGHNDVATVNIDASSTATSGDGRGSKAAGRREEGALLPEPVCWSKITAIYFQVIILIIPFAVLANLANGRAAH